MASEIERLLEMQQTGQYIPTEEEQATAEMVQQNPITPIPQPGPAFNQFRLPAMGHMRQDVLGMEAGAAGYGQSRYDRQEFVPEADLEHKRAIEQPGFWKVANGAIKGGIYAGTTAVNTVAGVIDGLLEGAYELTREAAEGERISIPKIVGAGVDNFTARTMADIQKMSDEWFPNYRTEQERSEQYQQEWMKHIFTANFIGDSFLKNFGFTVGALAGGAAWSKAIGAALSSGMSANLMKGVVAAAEGNEAAAAALGDTLKMIRSGAAVTIDDAQIAKNLAAAAKEINKFGTKMQLFGSVIAAMGEGTTEGVMARNEFMDKYLSQLDSDYINKYRDLENQLIQSLDGTDKIKFTPHFGTDGRVQMIPELNDAGLAILETERKKLADDYISRRNFAKEQGDRLAATTFLLNLPILTISDTIQFGRMLSGGWKTSRNTLAKVAGGITKDGQKLAANYAATGSVAGRTIANALKVGASESTEEMLQGVVSSGATNVADARVTSFNDDGYDARVMKSFGDWFKGMYEGGAEYLSDWKNWQEGFMGLVTGLVGMPGRTWNGGIAEAYRNAKEDASAEAAAILNNRVNSEQFQNAWKGYVRHMKYENEMEDAVKKNDQYSWKTSNDKQLVNDIMMFADAGRLQDLLDVVDLYANMSDAEAEEKGVVEAVTSDANKTEIDNNPSAAIGKVREQANNIKDTIKQYNDVYDAISTRVPIGTSSDQIRELTSTAMNIKQFEKRYLEMLDQVIQGLEPLIAPMAATAEDGSKVEDEAKTLERAKQIRSALASYYTNLTLPSANAVEDMLDVADVLKRMKDGAPFVDKETKTLFDDMQKVQIDRKRFIDKFMKLETMPSAEFEKKAATPEKLVTEAKKEVIRQEMSGLDTFEAVRKGYFEKDANGRADYMSNLSAIEDTNANAKSFLEMMRRNDGFLAYIDKNGIDIDNPTVSPRMVQSVLNDIIRRAKGEKELTELPDNVFPSFSEFSRDFTGMFGAPSRDAFEALKLGIRNAMRAYMGKESATSSRETISTDPTPQPEPDTVSTPDGYDAAQPASVEPAPAPLPAWMTEQTNPEPEVKEEPSQEEELPEPIVSVPTEDDLAEESMQASVDEMPESVEDEKVRVSGEKDKIAYYRTSIPEISTKEAKAARKAIARGDRAALMSADLSDFAEVEPKYADMWNALQQRGAFDNIAMRLEEGDEIEFIVDPSFPEYNGQYQILMTTVKNGERLVLNILSGQTSQYYNLSELRRTIDDEYQKFKETNPNDVFVFGKKSLVWAKRSGLVDYDYSKQYEKGIVDIPGYDENATIAFIDRNGEARNVRGNRNPIEHVSDTFDDTQYNIDNNKRGNLYYLAKTAKDKWIPIRLNVEHFKEETKDLDNPTFASIRESISKLAGIVAETNNLNLDEQNKKLHSELETLSKKLDLHDAYFELGQYDNVGVALRYSSPTNESALRRPDQMTTEWLTDLIAGLDRSVQIKLNDKGKIENLGDYIEQGLITSNAKMLRPKGVDFYINPWNKETGEFYAATEYQVQKEEEISNPASFAEPAPSVAEPMADDFEFGDRDDFGAFDEEAFTPTREEEQVGLSNEDVREIIMGNEADDPVLDYIHRKFSELPEDVKSALTTKGYSEDEYDSMGDIEKEKVIRCSGV